MNFAIRKATMQDYEHLCDVLAEVDRLHVQHLPEHFRPLASPLDARSREYLSGIIAGPNSTILLAEEGDQITGAVILLVQETPSIPILISRRYVGIDVIVVRGDRQGQGLGRALMAESEAWACSMGIRDIQLGVYLFNQKAIRFYEELGYTALSQKMEKKL